MLRSTAPLSLYALAGLVALGIAESSGPEPACGTAARSTARVVADAAEPAREMAAAATALLAALEDEERARATLAFDGETRTDWHYVPKKRAGVRLGDLDDAETRAVRALVRCALSARGALAVQGVLLLEEVLYELQERAAMRDPGNYTVAVFGDPGGDGPWGWRVEGHHLSLNVTVVGGELGVAATPLFFGANPGEVQHGPRAGFALLAEEDALGRALWASLDAEQRGLAGIAAEPPRDVVMVPGRDALPEPAGVPASALDEGQRARLWRIVEAFAGKLRPELAERELARIRASGIEGVRFAWAGSPEPGRPRYWRVQGPSFVIEYDDPYEHPGHAHTVWRDPARDFGRDLLRLHYEREHGGR